MPTEPVRCGRCRSALRGPVFNLPTATPCRVCGAETLAAVFPAFFRPEAKGEAGQALSAPEDASCFFHPRKRAAATCSRCGRFLCGLCAVELEGSIQCPTCLSADSASNKRPLETEAVLYDQVALQIGIWPLLLIGGLWFFWPVYLLTAGATLYLVVRYWNAPRRAFIPRSRARMILAGIFALVQLGAAVGLAFFTNGLLSRLWH